jgi:hypothetical protein
MNKDMIDFSERFNSGTSKTGHKEFDENGYLVIRNLYDPKDLYCEPPDKTGQYNYGKNIEEVNHNPVETQVVGSTSRYFYPPYKLIHSQVRIKLESAIGKKLYNTYYYDRFYNTGQELDKHTDRAACEISVTVHVGSNVSNPWPIWIKTPDTYSDETKREVVKQGEDRSVILHPGDGMIYKGCERPHWREPLPKEYEKKRKRFFFTEEVEKEGLYYHQIFFHYVLADGNRAQHAWDR